jgi:threonine dehydrogenase-like Zn-dependent dehydrogenase
MGSKARKVAIVGVGFVGSSFAYSLVNQSICDEILLVDRTPERAYAQALDLSHCMDFTHTRTKVYTGKYEDCGDSDIVVLCAGGNPIPGGCRSEVNFDIPAQSSVPQQHHSRYKVIRRQLGQSPVECFQFPTWYISCIILLCFI